MRRSLLWRLLCIALLLPSGLNAQQSVRVATYNIKFLNTTISPLRLEAIRAVVAELDADIIALQEIANRAALEPIFDPTMWDIVIDDDSNAVQDVALVVRRPLRAINLPPDLDADDEHFLFAGQANDHLFPDRRDVLCVRVSIPGESEPLHVMVHHAKSRLGGRSTTDPRREDASRALLSRLEQDFDGSRYILLGDFNDNPDDRSLNILEMGMSTAPAGPEEIDGPFLINATERLLPEDRVSWGIGPSHIVASTLNTSRPGSRARNNNERGTSGSVSPILFDQILFPVSMKSLYVEGSVRVFDSPIAVIGGTNAPSDHLPVLVDFVFSGTSPSDHAGSSSSILIAALLPNPAGEDRGSEQIKLLNASSSTADLQGWILRDRGGNTFNLSGTLSAGAAVTITLPPGTLPLNNDGDDVALIEPNGAIAHHVSYGQAASGHWFTFAP